MPVPADKADVVAPPIRFAFDGNSFTYSQIRRDNPKAGNNKVLGGGSFNLGPTKQPISGKLPNQGSLDESKVRNEAKLPISGGDKPKPGGSQKKSPP